MTDFSYPRRPFVMASEITPLLRLAAERDDSLGRDARKILMNIEQNNTRTTPQRRWPHQYEGRKGTRNRLRSMRVYVTDFSFWANHPPYVATVFYDGNHHRGRNALKRRVRAAQKPMVAAPPIKPAPGKHGGARTVARAEMLERIRADKRKAKRAAKRAIDVVSALSIMDIL